MPAQIKQEAINSAETAILSLTLGIEGLEKVKTALGTYMASPFEQAVSLILNAKGRIVITGMGKSGHIARKIAATLASTGTPAHFVHPAEASHGDLGMIKEEDVVFALSWSGETAELADLVAYTRRFGVPLLSMSVNANSTLSKAADVSLVIPTVTESCPNGLAPTTSTLTQLALGDALAVAVLGARGFTAQDFKVFHPGGKLGAKLKHVKDVMHTNEKLPLITSGASMSEALLTMSSKGFGCVGVVNAKGELIGIVTDGDLRRHMTPDLITKKVDEVMTSNPKTVHSDMLAQEALDKLNTLNITAIFVIENNAPIGILHIHDFLRIGVI